MWHTHLVLFVYDLMHFVKTVEHIYCNQYVHLAWWTEVLRSIPGYNMDLCGFVLLLMRVYLLGQNIICSEMLKIILHCYLKNKFTYCTVVTNYTAIKIQMLKSREKHLITINLHLQSAGRFLETEYKKIHKIDEMLKENILKTSVYRVKYTCTMTTWPVQKTHSKTRNTPKRVHDIIRTKHELCFEYFNLKVFNI